MIVLPFQNRTGDSTLDALGDVAADYVARGLRSHAVGCVRWWMPARRLKEAAARELTPTAARVLATDAGSGTIVLGAYDRAPGDSVQFQAQVLDTRTGRVLRLMGPVARRRSSLSRRALAVAHAGHGGGELPARSELLGGDQLTGDV